MFCMVPHGNGHASGDGRGIFRVDGFGGRGRDAGRVEWHAASGADSDVNRLCFAANFGTAIAEHECVGNLSGAGWHGWWTERGTTFARDAAYCDNGWAGR